MPPLTDADLAGLNRLLAALADAVADRILAKTALPAREVPPAALLSKANLARALDVSTATVDRLCREGSIPFVLVGESRRFDLGEVRAALPRNDAAAPPSSTPSKPSSSPPLVRYAQRRR